MRYLTGTFTAKNGLGQIHTYRGDGNNWDNLSFDLITKFSHGHHHRSGEGNDVINFTNLDNVQDWVVGRVEDFDPEQDEIRIEGVQLDLYDPPNNVRVVLYNGEHNDPDADPQQWLLIKTSGGGYVFYSLEGARDDRDGDGGANGGAQESHFILSAPDPDALIDVTYQPPASYPINEFVFDHDDGWVDEPANAYAGRDWGRVDEDEETADVIVVDVDEGDAGVDNYGRGDYFDFG